MKNDEASLRSLQSELGLIGVRAILTLLIAEVVSFFNVGKNMNDLQIAKTADLILEEYPHFKLSDFKLCFRRGMKLYYGELFDRLDGSILVGWLDEYEQDRRNLYQTLREEEKEKEKALREEAARKREEAAQREEERMKKNGMEYIAHLQKWIRTAPHNPVYRIAFLKSYLAKIIVVRDPEYQLPRSYVTKLKHPDQLNRIVDDPQRRLRKASQRKSSEFILRKSTIRST